MDIGGSHVTAALLDSGHPFVVRSRSSAALDSSASRDLLLDQLSSVASSLTASSWTIALPGPFDYVRGRGDFAGVGKFGSLAGVDLRTELAHRLNVPASEVRFLNDAVAYAIGEWVCTRDRPGRFVCVALGTGVGSAWLADGKPVEDGPDVPPRGWAHLLTFNGRPLEDTVSTRAIQADHLRRTGVSMDVREIAQAARAGDEAAVASWGTAVRALGQALGPWLHRFGAQRLVVGGSMSRSWDLLEAPLAAGIAAAGVPVPSLAPAALRDDAPLVGAAHWVSQQPAAPSPAPRP
nr:ROK family protein [uncultured Friedmanniella sp.]